LYYPLKSFHVFFPDIYNSPSLLVSKEVYFDTIHFMKEDASWIAGKCKEREILGFPKVNLNELPEIPLSASCSIEHPFKLGIKTDELFPYKVSALGGSFDRPHAGHKILLSIAALLPKDKLYIGLTHDSLLVKKKFAEALQSYETRKSTIKEFLHYLRPSMEVEIRPLFDSVGLAGTMEYLDSLLITTETLPGGKMVKEKREENKLTPIDFPILQFDEIEEKISSTDIRAIIIKKGQVDLSKVKNNWLSLMERLKIDEEIGKKWWDILLDHYAEDWRHYHVLKHVWDMLESKKYFKAPENLLFDLAIWFHDVIYCPNESDNEEQSVKLFEQFASESKIEKKEYVTKLIMATKYHKAEEDYDTKLLLDLDLEILARPNDEYKQYAANIRNEYSSYSDEMYRKGRIQILNSFLKKDSIFLTPEMREKYEARARENIQEEIKSLSQH